LNHCRQASTTRGLISTAVVRMRRCLWQNLVMLAAPRPSCMAWRLPTLGPVTNSSQAIMRSMYSRWMSKGASIFIVPCTHSLPRCMKRTLP